MSDEAKHTPGPWEVRIRVDGSKSVTGAYHHERGQHPWTGGILHVCDLSGDKHFDEANAWLIKAAPDMLKTLRAIASMDLHEIDGKDQTAETMRRCARAAIAKATPPNP